MKKPAKPLLLIKILIIIIYALVCWFYILWLSTHDYEWWIGENNGGVPFTICTIPPSSGESYKVWSVPTLVSIIVLLVFGLADLIKKLKINLSLILSIVLLAYWWYRFWGRMLFCSGQ